MKKRNRQERDYWASRVVEKAYLVEIFNSLNSAGVAKLLQIAEVLRQEFPK